MESESTARTAFLYGLIDYAGLFPPESRDMAGAVEGYRDARALQSWMVNRFICPDGRLEELAGYLGAEPDAWPLAVTISPPFGEWSKGIADDARSLAVEVLAMRDVARFELAEVRIPPDLVAEPALAAMLASVRTSLGALFDWVLFEISLSDDWVATLPIQLQAIKESGTGAKIRCGGLAVEDFPTAEQVATFVSIAVRLGVPFKATAGLHHPLHHWDADPGVMRHGFLNLTGAAILAKSLDIGIAELTELISEESEAGFELTDLTFRWRHRVVTMAEIQNARTEVMLGYGSCSFTEPVADLVELGML